MVAIDTQEKPALPEAAIKHHREKQIEIDK